MLVLFIGDSHGDWQMLQANLLKLWGRGIRWDLTVQVGDFGFYKGIQLTYPKKGMASLPPMHFIDGNHEDHEFLSQAKKVRKNLGYIERGTIWEKDGCRIGFIGGALNVDRPQEHNAANFPSYTEIQDFIKKVNDVGGVDVMVTHSCPGGRGVGVTGLEEFQDSARRFVTARGYIVYNISDIGDEPLTTLYDHISPRPLHWIFGHFHRSHKSLAGTTNFYCVGSCDDSGVFAPVLLDTLTKQIL
jgi:predicted phosphodiesterase